MLDQETAKQHYLVIDPETGKSVNIVAELPDLRARGAYEYKPMDQQEAEEQARILAATIPGRSAADFLK